MKVRELLIHWGFKVNNKPLQQMERQIKSTKSLIKTTTVALAGISAATAYFLNQSGKMEQWKISFETMLGSADKAKDLIEEIKEFARKTPFQLPGVIQSSKQLLAFGIEQQKIIPTLKSLGDVAAGLGVPLDRLILNFGQVKAQSKLTGRELRDFAIAGVPLLAELAKMLGKTEAEIQGLVSKGEIGFPQVEQAFASMTGAGGRFNNLMAKQSKSFFGILSNIKDFITQIAIAIGDKLLPRAKQLAKQFLTFLEINRKMIELKAEKIIKILLSYFEKTLNLTRALAASFMGFIIILGGLENAIRLVTWTMTSFLALNIATTLGSVFMAIRNVILGLKTMGNAAVIAQVKAALIPLAIGAAIIGLGLIIEDIISFFQGKKSVTGAIVEAVNKLPAPLQLIVKGVFATFMPIIGLFKLISASIKFIVDGGIKKTITSIIEFTSKLKKPLQAFADTFMLTLKPIITFFNLIKDVIGFISGGGIKKALGAVKGIGKIAIKPFDLMDKVAPMAKKLKDMPIFEGLKDKAAPFLNKIKEGVKGISAPVLTNLKDMPFMEGMKDLSMPINPFAVNPMQLAGAGANAGGGNQVVNDMKIDNKINVTVPPDTPPELVGEKIREGTDDAISRMIRQTNNLIEDRGE
ncbi:MAG: tape measure protein [bacterium]|nr:tape measure protein [bacterium]